MSCRDRRHGDCPELRRQRRKDLSETEKASSHLCACQHDGSDSRPSSMLQPADFHDGPECAHGEEATPVTSAFSSRVREVVPGYEEEA